MNAAFRLTLLFLVLFITGQTWGLSVTHHQYDAGNVDHDTNEYVYDADVSLQFCRGNQSQGKNAKDGYLLAFIGDFLAAKGTKGLETRGVKPAPGTRVRPEGVPDGWRIRPTRGKGGTEYYNPKNPNESVRVMQGNPNSPYPNSQKPYVRQRDSSGSYLDANGNRGANKSSDTHISLDQFRFRE